MIFALGIAATSFFEVFHRKKDIAKSPTRRVTPTKKAGRYKAFAVFIRIKSFTFKK
jgi:hypothetical protein